ncbi:nucleotidyltransferase domain-containing protein [Niallia sp.]|uniref:nucleotidyltransferase domain-containing protein n=1 Tax=Niallia sp. TaxID=2837523 RepID=UPI0028A183F2|nr:nucleotidyltransferase domain-containing protein [Niallia sp.]
MERLEPIKAAHRFIDTYFTNCNAAILAGSVVRGQATATSDLDIVIFDEKIEASYRESVLEFGWPIELFVHNLSSYKDFFLMDYNIAKPSMQRMVVEGIVLRDNGILQDIRQEAEKMLEEGPKEWTEDTIRTKRYFISDVLDDFIGSDSEQEVIFIASTLSFLLYEFVLRVNKQWIGTSKWMVRSLQQYDTKFADEFIAAFDTFYRNREKVKIILLADKVLQPYGGKLFAGFSIGKDIIQK